MRIDESGTASAATREHMPITSFQEFVTCMITIIGRFTGKITDCVKTVMN